MKYLVTCIKEISVVIEIEADSMEDAESEAENSVDFDEDYWVEYTFLAEEAIESEND